MLFLPCAFAGLALALPQGPEDPEDPGLALAPSPKLAPHPAHLQGPQVHPLQGLKGKVLFIFRQHLAGVCACLPF